MGNPVTSHIEQLFSEEPDSRDAPLLLGMYKRYLRVARGGGDGFLDSLTRRLVRGWPLTREEARHAMEIIMEGSEDRESVALFLSCSPPERLGAEELAAYAEVMREKAESIRPGGGDGPLLDTCGTGGDVLKTFNVSTAAALVAAAAGVRVAKHGNRGITSSCGSADVLEALGVAIDLEPSEVQACIEEVGIGFLYAPRFHKAMKNVQSIRKALAAEAKPRQVAIRTMFNVLGPLTNPAGAGHQLIGVYEGGLVRTFAEVLRRLGVRRALVVHGTGPEGKGMDELSTLGATRVAEVDGDEIREYETTAADLGLGEARAGDLLCDGDARSSAQILDAVLSGSEKGPRRDFVAANSGAALFVAGRAPTLAAGVAMAAGILESGKARQKLDDLTRWTVRAAAGKNQA